MPPGPHRSRDSGAVDSPRMLRITAGLYRGGFENLLGADFVMGLLARLEGQRLGKLDRDSAQKAVDALDSAHVTRAGEVGHIESFVLPVPGDAETSRDVLAGVRAFLFGIACERRSSAGNIDHLPL